MIGPLRVGALACASVAIALTACSGSKITSGPSAATGSRIETSGLSTEVDEETGRLAATQACLDAWNWRKHNPALTSFLIVSGGRRGLERVSVGFAEGAACLISFAGANGLLSQAIEVDPPNGHFTGLWPPGRVENFDPRPAGWNASANANGWISLVHVGPRPPRSISSADTSVFPNSAEHVVLDATPSDGWECQRSDERTEGSTVGVLCDPQPRVQVRYERYDTPQELDSAYWGYFESTAQRFSVPGRTCMSSDFAEGRVAEQGQEAVGRLFCYVSAEHRAGLVWKDDATHILAFASGRDREELVRWWREGNGRIGAESMG